ncbi:MAG: hypothetical protein JRF15_14795, partial [Deltaproteobacteria bacterium]|nr:hypothetical protein [Deltaproteobacteria bacterium]
MVRFAIALLALAAAVSLLLWLQRDRSAGSPDEVIPIQAQGEPPPELVLSAIERLESESDAKCNSSANRFEDFLYGTPLADEGRWANVELQKRWVEHIWAGASRVAARAGEAEVSPQRLREQIEVWFAWRETGTGEIEVRFAEHPALTIAKLRADQYGSIAFSLRAMLSVQQDRILASEGDLLELAPDGIELLRESTDMLTLSALMIADQSAREHNQFEIAGDTLRTAWSTLLPDMVDSSSPGAGTRPAMNEASRARLLAMLDELIAGKLSAYEAYNDLGGQGSMEDLFRGNVARFYARAPSPTKRQTWTEFLSAFKGRLNEFARSLLDEASVNADAAGHDLIRAADASRAVQHLIPHEIDDFEDVRMFPRLAATDQITLEAYDCDSFRDFGLHWPPLQRAIHVLP